MGYAPAHTVTPFGYTIYKTGSTCLGVKNSNGATIKQSTDIGIVCNSIIADIGSGWGSVIQIMPGTYSLSTPVVCGEKAILFDGGMMGGYYAPYSNGITCINLESALGANYAISQGGDSNVLSGGGLKNIVFYGQGHTNHLGAVYCKNTNWYWIENLYVASLWNSSTGGYGVNLEVNGLWGYKPTILNMQTYQCRVGLRIGAVVHSACIIHGWFVGRSAVETNGILLEGPDTCLVYGADVESHAHANGKGVNVTSGQIYSFFGLRTEGNTNDVTLAGTGYHRFFGGNIDTVADTTTNPSKFINVHGYRTENWGTSTGTGAQQTIAHGLAATPSCVMLSDKETGAVPYQSAAANATNIYVTAALNQDWSWLAKV